MVTLGHKIQDPTGPCLPLEQALGSAGAGSVCSQHRGGPVLLPVCPCCWSHTPGHGSPHSQQPGFGFGFCSGCRHWGRADQSLPGFFFFFSIVLPPFLLLCIHRLWSRFGCSPGLGAWLGEGGDYTALGVFVCKTMGQVWQFKGSVSEREGIK